MSYKCEICHSTEIIDSIYPGTIFKNQKFRVKSCSECRHEFIWPIAEPEVLKELYQETTYIELYERESLDFEIIFFRNAILPTIQDKQDLRVLDYGCGNGAVGSKFQQEFPSCTVVSADIVDERFERQGEFIPIDSETGDLLGAYTQFDILLVCDVLEHVPNLHTSLRVIKKCLKNNGLLIMSLPVERSRSLTWYLLSMKFSIERKLGRREDGDYPPHHLRFFSECSLAKFEELMSEYGFKIQSVCRYENGWPLGKTGFQGILRSLIVYCSKLSGFYFSNRYCASIELHK